MASTDARPVPRKNIAYRVTFPIFDADGDLVTAVLSPDSEVSKDAGVFTNCVNEATEITTASGMYYLDLTAAEMNADTVTVIVKTLTVGAKTTPIVLYPEETGDIRVNVTQISNNSMAADNLQLFFDGTGYVAANSTVGTVTTNTDMRGTNNALLAASAPANFGDLAIMVTTGQVTVGTNNDKTGYSISGTKTTLDTLNDLTAAQVNAQVDLAISDVNLDHLVGTAIGVPAVPAGTFLDQVMGDGAAVYDRATDSLQAIRDRGDVGWVTATGFSTHTAANVWSTVTRTLTANTNLNDPTAVVIAGAVLEEPLIGHITAGTLGKAVADIETDAIAILADTADIQPKIGTPATDIAADIAALNNVSISQILTTQMTESYAADGATPTIAQALMMIQQMLGEFSIAGTTLTVNKVDGLTSAATYTLNDATSPSSVTRTT